MANRLAKESSPYLRQHQDNPVDWYPWGEEALARARAENKPIHLSVGYSACHWCHVMAHESFENPEVARVMNERFVNIKVDREERPDLDQIYQNVAQLMTGGGGWPLTVFLTPELKPFFGGTYFPPQDNPRYGRPGFTRVLTALSDAFHNQPETVAENAGKLMDAIAQLETAGAGSGPGAKPAIETLVSAAEKLLGHVDWVHGGTGSAPKFPNAMIFTFLWRIGYATGSEEAKKAVELTLRRMAEGGIYDHLGGGFSRYSVDHQWLVPHFEKMLYDNALLLKLYSEVLLTGGEGDRALYLRTLEETIGWVEREMTSKEGGFFAAQDADSEGEEGKFFVWKPEEIRAELDLDEARFLELRFGVTLEGNFEESGATVLHVAMPIEDVARRVQETPARVREGLESARGKLFAAREKRVRPGLDDKVLVAWNGLMISGLAWASLALRAEGSATRADQAARLARQAYAFVRERAAKQGDRLHSSIQAGVAKNNAYLDDYAFLAMAALDLTRLTDDAKTIGSLLDDCERWLGTIRKHFRDPAGRGYFFTSDDHEKLIQRPKTVMDQAIPSGTAVALACMSALAEIDRGGKGAAWGEEVETQLCSLSAELEKSSYGFGEMLNLALLEALGPVVVSGPQADEVSRHPQIFQKERDAQASGLLVCHRRTCSLPMSELQAARAEALKHARVS